MENNTVLETNQKYNIELNMMRGICTLIVIMVHLLSPLYDNMFVFFFSYILLVFFFLSGYFTKAIPIGKQLKKRLWEIGKPFLIYFFCIAFGCGFILMGWLLKNCCNLSSVNC